MGTAESPSFADRSLRLTQVREAVRQRREVKSSSKELLLGGLKGAPLEEILDLAKTLIPQIWFRHQAWIEEKMKQLPAYFPELVSDSDEGSGEAAVNFRSSALKEYRHGLVVAITQTYRHFKDDSDQQSKLKDPDHLQGVIIGYTFDFYRTLRVCQRLGVSQGVAIRIARMAYHFDPNKLIELTSRYQNLSRGEINLAVLAYPSDPDAFLEGFVETFSRLKDDPHYHNLPLSLIERAAIGFPSDPDAFLRGTIKNDYYDEYIGFWVYLNKRYLVEKAVSLGYLGESDGETLKLFFDEDGPPPPKKVLEGLSIAVANLA